MLRNFVWNVIVYPLFRSIIDEKLNAAKPGFVKSFQITDKGLTKVYIDKKYPLASHVILYKQTTPLYDPDSQEYLGHLEEVYAKGYVIEYADDFSVVLLNNQSKNLEVGLLSKVM